MHPVIIPGTRRRGGDVVIDFYFYLQKNLTARGLNSKFMDVKSQVLSYIASRGDVLESEIRKKIGNNPDTSKALR